MRARRRSGAALCETADITLVQRAQRILAPSTDVRASRDRPLRFERLHTRAIAFRRLLFQRPFSRCLGSPEGMGPRPAVLGRGFREEKGVYVAYALARVAQGDLGIARRPGSTADGLIARHAPRAGNPVSGTSSTTSRAPAIMAASAHRSTRMDLIPREHDARLGLTCLDSQPALRYKCRHSDGFVRRGVIAAYASVARL